MSDCIMQLGNILDREVEILEYIGQNLGCTKTELTNYMDPYKGEKYAAPNTTGKILKRLIKEKKVICKVDRDGRSHHLYLNDKNKFIMINQLLSKMHIMLDKIDNQKIDSKSSIALIGITNYSLGFRMVCDDALRSLLINTDKIIPIEGDCHKLYIRIIKVLKELDGKFPQSTF